MKSIFDLATNEELIGRIGNLSENSIRQWGKMTVYQMLKHCTLWEEMISGKVKYKRAFIGRVFGKMVLKSVVKDDTPIKRNTPTIADFIIKGDGDVASEKAKWIAQIRDHANFSNHDFVHPFFGKMTKEQIGYMAYKHADHHLRQFSS